MIRKPLLFLCVLAAGASLVGGGRLSLRLFLDTATALAVIPVLQVVALAAVYWTGPRRVPFGPAVEAFFDGSGPWFAAVAVLGLFGAFASPVAASEWFTRIAAISGLTAATASARLDFRFFRHCLGRARGRAAADVAVQRIIAWGGTLFVLLAMSLPKVSSFVPNIATNLLGARL